MTVKVLPYYNYKILELFNWLSLDFIRSFVFLLLDHSVTDSNHSNDDVDKCDPSLDEMHVL